MIHMLTPTDRIYDELIANGPMCKDELASVIGGKLVTSRGIDILISGDGRFVEDGSDRIHLTKQGGEHE